MNRPSKQLSYRRVTVYLTQELERTVIEFRKTEEYCRCSYAEIIRQMMTEGARAMKTRLQSNGVKQ